MQIDAKAFALGNALRAYLAGRGAKKPMAYLYGHVAKEGKITTHDMTFNGVDYVGAILPKLPEWNKDQYQYAYIHFYEADDVYSLYVLEKKPDVDKDINNYDNTRLYLYNSAYMKYELIDGVWVYSGSENTAYAHSLMGYTLIWVNFDLAKRDGSTVYLRASDCVSIPIYE